MCYNDYINTMCYKREVSNMASKLVLRETEQLLRDFCIRRRIPSTIITDGDLIRWRKAVICDHLDRINEKDTQKNKMR